MTGPRDSVIGVKTALVIKKLTTQMPTRFETEVGPGQFGAVVVEVDATSGRATSIDRLLYYEG
jgi:calcineurin-like phosphoesterase